MWSYLSAGGATTSAGEHVPREADHERRHDHEEHRPHEPVAA